MVFAVFVRTKFVKPHDPLLKIFLAGFIKAVRLSYSNARNGAQTLVADTFGVTALRFSTISRHEIKLTALTMIMPPRTT